VARIHGAAGLLRNQAPLAVERPFRAPHHTASTAGLLGGGNPPRPGEISLAHRGVLFLDELPEFRRDVLEAIRQPLEEKRITVARAWGACVFPSDFQLVAAMNPCPCGRAGDPARPCGCGEAARRRYASGSQARCSTASTCASPCRPCRGGISPGRPGPSAEIRQLARALGARRAAPWRPVPAKCRPDGRRARAHRSLDAAGSAGREGDRGSGFRSAASIGPSGGAHVADLGDRSASPRRTVRAFPTGCARPLTIWAGLTGDSGRSIACSDTPIGTSQSLRDGGRPGVRR
jgi:hypothetical protein